MRESTLRRTSVAVGTLISLLLGEVVLRAVEAVSREDTGDLARAAGVAAPPVTGDCRTQREQATLAALVRPSDVPDVLYELKPRLDTCFTHVRVRTGDDGLRLPAPVHPKLPGTYRVLLLGDSQVFGWGLEDDQTLGARLAHELGTDATPVEVVNAGVPGYNTAQEAAWLRARGPAYRPDCVMVLFVDNDLALPPFVQRPRSALLSGPSRLLARVASYFATGTRGTAGPWWELTPAADQVGLGERATDREHGHLVGLAGYRGALASIAETASSLGIPAVNVADYGSLPGDWAAVAHEQESLGIVHVAPGLSGGASELSFEGDPHLNPRGVAELARRVAGDLARRRVCVPGR
jgi:hypothetical protein